MSNFYTLGRRELRGVGRYPRPASDHHARAAVVLTEAAERDLEQAELFLLSLDTETLTADGPRTAYLLGLSEGHLANLVERLRELSHPRAGVS